MTDVYYFGSSQNPNDSDDIVLIKLGNEIHGLIDEMNINDNHILYKESLRDDSRVVESIVDYKNIP